MSFLDDIIGMGQEAIGSEVTGGSGGGFMDGLLSSAQEATKDFSFMDYIPDSKTIFGSGLDPKDKSFGQSFLSELLGPKNVLAGLGAVGSSLMSKSKEGDAAEAAAAEFEQTKELLALKHKNDLELLAARGGGGAGGGGAAAAALAYQQKRDRLAAIMGSRQAQIGASRDGTSMTLAALKNLIDAGQRPLAR